MSINNQIRTLFCCLSMLMITLLSSGHEDPRVVAWVDNHAITLSEFQHWISLEKANTYNYFYQKYEVDGSRNFWTQKFGKEIPLEKLKEVALEKLKRCKVQQIMALDMGIIESADYDRILDQRQAFNTKRKLKVSTGQPVYGPIALSHRLYFSYVFDDMVIKLKDKLRVNEQRSELWQKTRLKGDGHQIQKQFSSNLTTQSVDDEYNKYLDEIERTMTVRLNSQIYESIMIN